MLNRLRKFILPIEQITKYIPHDSNILDIGCGDHQILQYIDISRVKSYTGFDVCVKKSITENNVRIFNSSWNDMLNEIKNYDLILVIDILHHINKNHQKLLIKKTLSNMKSGSILIYKDISNKNLFFGLMNRLHDLIYNFQIINYYDSKNIINMIDNHKFTYNHFNKKKFWYDHEFIIITRV